MMGLYGSMVPQQCMCEDTGAECKARRTGRERGGGGGGRGGGGGALFVPY